MNNELEVIENAIFSSMNDVEALTVRNQETLEWAAGIRGSLVSLKKKILETFDPIVEKTRLAWKESIAQKDKHLNPVEQAIKTIDNKVLTYRQECEKKRQAEEERLRKEAEARAEKERAKLEARAEKWETKGNVEKAEELKEKAEQVEPITPVVMPTIQKVNGLSARKNWKVKIVDFTKLSDEYKLPNITLLNSIARSSKGKMKIEGVVFVCEETLIGR